MQTQLQKSNLFFFNEITYSRRIAVAEGFETDATRIIASLLYSPFHERCCRYQIPFRRRRISNSLERKKLNNTIKKGIRFDFILGHN